MVDKENQHIITDQEIEEIKTMGIRVLNRLQDSDFGLLTNYVYNVIDFLMRRYRGKDVAVTLLQVAEIMNVNKMTIWSHIKQLKEAGYLETYCEGIPRRQYFVNHYKDKTEIDE